MVISILGVRSIFNRQWEPGQVSPQFEFYLEPRSGFNSYWAPAGFWANWCPICVFRFSYWDSDRVCASDGIPIMMLLISGCRLGCYPRWGTEQVFAQVRHPPHFLAPIEVPRPFYRNCNADWAFFPTGFPVELRFLRGADRVLPRPECQFVFIHTGIDAFLSPLAESRP